MRHIIARQGLSLTAKAPFDPALSLAQALLKPTRIYVKSIKAALKAVPGVKALAHITGGGLTENLPRVLPEKTAAEIDLGSFRLPAVFAWLMQQGGVAPDEMLRTFNCGIGMMLIAPQTDIASLRKTLEDAGESVYEIGRVVSDTGEPCVRYIGDLR